MTMAQTHNSRSGRTVVIVEDEGVGLRPRPDSPGLGLGLPTMAQVADRLHIDDGAGCGVRVELRFRLDD